MITGVYQINIEQMKRLIFQHLQGKLAEDEMEVMLHAGRNSETLVTILFRGELLGFVGLVPKTLISTDAYLWLYHTDKVDEHKTVFGRWAHQFIAKAKRRHSAIIGHCMNQPSIDWLTTLGAKFKEPINGIYPFEIRGVE